MLSNNEKLYYKLTSTKDFEKVYKLATPNCHFISISQAYGNNRANSDVNICFYYKDELDDDFLKPLNLSKTCDSPHEIIVEVHTTIINPEYQNEGVDINIVNGYFQMPKIGFNIDLSEYISAHWSIYWFKNTVFYRNNSESCALEWKGYNKTSFKLVFRYNNKTISEISFSAADNRLIDELIKNNSHLKDFVSKVTKFKDDANKNFSNRLNAINAILVESRGKGILLKKVLDKKGMNLTIGDYPINSVLSNIFNNKMYCFNTESSGYTAYVNLENFCKIFKIRKVVYNSADVIYNGVKPYYKVTTSRCKDFYNLSIEEFQRLTEKLREVIPEEELDPYLLKIEIE